MTLPLTIESLGISKDDLTDRIVERVSHAVLHNTTCDEDGDERWLQSEFSKTLQALVVDKINKAVEDIAGKNVLPNVASYVEGLCLQETNRWGEKVGKPVTFVEYLVSRAESYLREEVDYEGRSKAERSDSYSWRSSGTRVSYMIHKHLQYSIETAMKDALKTANASIVGGLQKAVEQKLAEISVNLNVDVR